MKSKSKLEDLQALGKMLDEGKIDRDEYARLKAELMAEEEPATTNSMEGKPPGWHNDPSGTAQHQAFWDGEKGTGQTRTQFQANVADGRMKPTDPRPFYRRGGFILAIAVIGLIIAGIADSLSEDSVEPTLEDILMDSIEFDRVSLEGQGDGDTRTFRLNGGS